MSVREDRLHILLKKGEAAAWRELFRRFYPSLYSFSVAMLKDSRIAQDVVQEAFMKLWIHRDKISSTEHLERWLFMVVKNEIIDYFRVMKPIAESLAAAENAVEERTAEDESLYDETSEIIRKGVNSLPTQRRQVFIMSRFGQLSNREISLRMGLSIRTVERHLALAIKNLGYICDDKVE